MPDVDYYELLGIRPDATSAEIKSAYRALVRTMHPDTGGSAGMFRLLQRAYETLGDADRRAEYDRRLREADEDPAPGPTVSPAPTRPRRRRFGDDPDFLPDVPDIDVASIPWWDSVDHAAGAGGADSRCPGHGPGVLTAGVWVLLIGVLILPIPLSVPLLVGWILLLALTTATTIPLGRWYRSAIHEIRGFRDEFGTRAVFGNPGGDRDQIAERLTADVLARYLTRLPGVCIFHGLAWPDSVFADIDHAVLCGRRLVLVESKSWLPGHYSLDRSGELLRNGRRFRGGGSRLTESLREFRRLLPEVEIRGALVIYPNREGDVTTERTTAADPPPMTVDQFVRQIGAWLAHEPTTVEHEVFRTVLAQVVS